MKRITKVREEAALLCAIAASTMWRTLYDEAGRWEDQSGAPDNETNAGRLANAAHAAACKYEYGIDAPWAEAECLLREGWCP